MHSESTEHLWRRIAEQAWNVAKDTDPESTVRLFEELVPFMDAQDPDDVFQLASAYYYANNHFKAQLFLEFVIKRGLSEENRPLAILQMADSLRSLGRGEDALRWLDFGLAEYPGEEPGRWFAALKVRTLADLGRHDEVVDMALGLLGMPAELRQPPKPSDSVPPQTDPTDRVRAPLRRRDLRVQSMDVDSGESAGSAESRARPQQTARRPGRRSMTSVRRRDLREAPPSAASPADQPGDRPAEASRPAPKHSKPVDDAADGGSRESAAPRAKNRGTR
ncbi:tetratricopeptide repeat protein [Pseudoclavibacter sp. 13-3]|uniref:tetratricopeptide repeat protein n=1 Tax=Pseudoclavibacter sp. 13-3 TaxID=2901228 RepID=UPI001E3E1608|nr:tetratricopeptide repeat protein [Pseudoclavibacter sp. 13-3]MCD7101686.1 tetratricopeptide repeat protein [Pseudoclavibacter sp. 13-3]